MYKRIFKRLLDITISALAIIILLPFFVLFTPLVAVAMKGNPFFVQKRPGKNGKIFFMIKFRTMTNAKDGDGNLLPDAKRLTKFGKLMRKLSVDELPELFNILWGDMSIVGPRPLLVEYLPLYNEFQSRRHEVRPGLTGLAQISGRNAISWEQKFAKDIEYVDNISFKNDIKIILKTVKKVLKSEDISQQGQATMEYFLGSDNEKKAYNDKNVLILSAGRRVELVQSFKNALDSLRMTNSKIIAVDISKYAPALYFADKHHIIPRISDDKYLPAIIDICKQEQIDLIVPTIDTELQILADNKEYIEQSTNAKVLISNKECIEICNDKTKSIDFLISNGFMVPKTLTQKDIKNKNYEFPLFIKPSFGSSSKDTFKINNETELEFFYSYVDKPIVQEMIVAKEYTVDVCLDFDSNIISVVPRIRISTRSGEILQGQIDKNEIIIEDVKKLMQVLKPIGHITVQCFLLESKVYYIEINPRFGGGAPMSFYVGAHSPEFILRLLNGETVPYYQDYQNGIVFSRYDSCIKVAE